MRSLTVLTLMLGCLIAACSQSAPAPASKPDLAGEEKAIRDIDARWLKAAQSRDPSGEAAVFANDGVAYREHVDPLVGPAAYQAFETKFFADNPKVNGAWTTDAIRLAESGDLAIQTGEFHNTALGPKGDRADKGRFVTVWKKVNGEWKVAHDIGSTTMPEIQVVKKP
jgi:uncharacterized protein (TIGR02246 family)